MVRHMAETFANSEHAYAMEKTGRYFSEEEIKERRHEPAVKKWREACTEFYKMPSSEQLDWRDRTARHPTLEDVIVRSTKDQRSS